MEYRPYSITGKLALLSRIKPLSKNRLNLNTGEYRLDIVKAPQVSLNDNVIKRIIPISSLIR